MSGQSPYFVQLMMMNTRRSVNCLVRHLSAISAASLFAFGAHADVSVPTGGSMSLGGGIVDLACTDVIVGGTLNVGSGQLINVRDVTILAGGAISATTGSITLGRNWSNQGSFTSGMSTVAFLDSGTCASASSIGGNTSFYNLTLRSTTGRVVTLASGSTQTVLGSLTIIGTSVLPIVLVSSAPPATASLALTGAGQIIANVSVNNVAATGQWLAAGQSNRNPTGFAPNWFGDGLVVPTLGSGGLALLIVLMVFFAALGAGVSRRTGIREGMDHV